MAKFLDTDGVSHRLHQLINNSEEILILISPYLRINERIKRLLEDKEGLNRIEIWVVHGKDELKPAEKSWLNSRTSIRTKFIQNMHAKCYLNEREAIVTSMNLHQYSQIHNYEMGIYVTRDGDPGLYDKIHEEAMEYLRMRDESRTPTSRVPKEADKASGPITTARGFCIRCRREMKEPYLKFAYCTTCYEDWETAGKDIYKEEKFCHICGIQRGHITNADFVCSKECRKKYRDLLGSSPVPTGSAAR